MHEKDYPKARAIFDEVAQEPAADDRDKAIAVYEKGYTWMEEVIFLGTSLSAIRNAVHDAQSHFLEAARIYPENTVPGQALLHLADKVLELGDQIWSKELLTKAGDIFCNGDLEPIMAKIKNWDDARSRWPNLMRKRGWLKPILKWLSVVMLAVFVCASCDAGTNSFNVLALTDLSYHQGNQNLLALFDHQGN